MAMKNTILAGVAALMLSASTAQGMLNDVQSELVGERLALGSGDCMKRAAKGDLVTAHLRIRIDEESSTGTPGELIGDTRSEQGGLPFSFIMGDHGTVLPALDEALKESCAGETVRVRLPSKEAYGPDGVGDIPGHADIEFEIEVIGVRVANKTASFEERNEKEDIVLDIAKEEDLKVVPAPPKPGPEAVSPIAPEYEDVIMEEDDDDEEVEVEVEEEKEAEPEPPKKEGKKVERKFVAAFKDDADIDRTNLKPGDQKIGENIDFFATVDDDKDGWVTEAEFKDFVKKMRLKWSYWRAIFVTQDKDNDQRLSWWEWTGPKGSKPPSYMGFQDFEWEADE